MNNLKIFKNIYFFYKNFQKIIYILDRKNSFYKIFLFSFFIVIFETVAVSLVYGISNVIFNIENYNNNFLVDNLVNFSNYYNLSKEFFLIFSFFLLIFLKNILSILFIFYKNNYLSQTNRKISVNLFNNFLTSKYEFFIKKNSSELISLIQQDIALLMRNIESTMMIIIEITLIFFIFIYLLTINLKVGFGIVLGSVMYFLLYISYTKKKFHQLGNERLNINQLIIKDLKESFENFREMKIYNILNIFLLSVNKKFRIFYSNLKITGIYQQVSKVLIEQVFILTIFLVFLSNLIFFRIEMKDLIILMITYFYAFMRTLPSLNKIVMETQTYLYTKVFVDKIENNLYEKRTKKIENVYKKKHKKFEFSKNIKFLNVSFFYESEKLILKDLNIQIKKGDKIGIIGDSGEGKTTFLNLLMGFIKPKKGDILADGNQIFDNVFWYENLAYVSQSTPLFDGSILKNITFLDEIENLKNQDILHLNNVIKQSGLGKFFRDIGMNFNYVLGERGSKISGGEVLRIALARALYNKPKVLILDEFSSALDIDTESKILETLSDLNITMVIVSHKLNTLRICNTIYKLKNYKLQKLEK